MGPASPLPQLQPFVPHATLNLRDDPVPKGYGRSAQPTDDGADEDEPIFGDNGQTDEQEDDKYVTYGFLHACH
jgi:hypothetical protein